MKFKNFEQNSPKNERFLPAHYTVDELKQMDPDRLQKICAEQDLGFESVVRLLGVSEEYKSPQTEVLNVSVHPDIDFIDEMKTLKFGTLQNRTEHNLKNIERHPELIDAYLENAEADFDELEGVSWERAGHLREQIRVSYMQHMLQKGLRLYDSFSSSETITESAKRKRVFDELAGEYNAGDNISMRKNGYAKALSYFGVNVHSLKEVQGELASLLSRLDNQSVTEDEKKNLNILLRAVKGNYFRDGDTTVNAGIYGILLPELTKLYEQTRPRNRLDAGTVQGSEVYEGGVYAGENYEKTQRPRRYGDGLGSN